MGRARWIIPAILLLIIGAMGAVSAESEVDRFLREAVSKLDGRELGKEDLRQLANLSAADQRRLLAIQARYRRVMEDNPVAAMEMLLRALVDERVAQKWARESQAERRQAQRAHRSAARQARQQQLPAPAPVDELRIHAPIPAIETWQIDEEHAYLVVEAVRTMADLGNLEQAQALCQAMGAGWGYGLPRILAGEVYGDVLAANNHPREALAAYDFALEVAEEAIAAGMTPLAEIEYIQGRVKQSRQRVQRLLDMPAAAQWYTPNRNAQVAYVHEIWQQIRTRQLSNQEFKRLQRFHKQLDGDELQAEVAAIIAHLHRRAGDHDQALALLAPHLLDSDAVDQGAAEALADPSQWLLRQRNARAAYEAGRVFYDRQKPARALAAWDRLRDSTILVPHVLAVTAGAEQQMAGRRWDQAIELYRYNLDLLPWFLVTPSGERTSDDYQEIAALRQRNRNGLERAQRLREADRYGPGFVAWREAERLRRKEQDHVAAYQAYQSVIAEYEESIYAEAARVHQLYSLLALSETHGVAAVEGALKAADTDVQDARRALSEATQSDVVDVLVADVKERLAQAHAHQAAIQAIPTGTHALRAAEKRVDDLSQSNPTGLYRGQARLLLADHYLMQRLDPDPAQAHLQALWEWLDQVSQTDQTLDGFQVPAQAREVSAAPEQTYQVDEWGNMTPADIPIGALVNRREVPWYLDDLRAQAARHLGFLAFVDGDEEAARRYFTIMGKADEQVQWAVDRGGPNMLRRLMVRVEDGTFRRSRPEELAPFSNRRRRLVVFLADFLAETEQPQRARALYQRLLDEDFGGLTLGEEAYARFGAAWSIWYAGSRDSERGLQKAANKQLMPFLERPELRATAVGPRALAALGNGAAMLHDYERGKGDHWQVMEQAYQTLIVEFPNTANAEKAYFRLGTEYLLRPDSGKQPQGKTLLEQQLRRFPEGTYAQLAKQLLREHREAAATSDQAPANP